MSGLNGLFGIGSNALATFQRALSVTGQNIANVSTPGYSRQEITLSESLPENGQPVRSEPASRPRKSAAPSIALWNNNC
jgi:flagellar hook-associated protein FlgK